MKIPLQWNCSVKQLNNLNMGNEIWNTENRIWDIENGKILTRAMLSEHIKGISIWNLNYLN